MRLMFLRAVAALPCRSRLIIALTFAMPRTCGSRGTREVSVTDVKALDKLGTLGTVLAV